MTVARAIAVVLAGANRGSPEIAGTHRFRLRLPSSAPTPRAGHRRVIVIWPVANAPEHEFEPLYVPVIVIVVRSRCAMPVALDEHPDDIMLLVGMSIVNAMSSPDIVPRNDPGIRPCIPELEKLMGPVTVDPFCVSCHVIVPMSVCPIMLPAPIEPLESDPMPAHVPVTDGAAIEPDGAVGELPPHAAANDVNTTTASAFLMWFPSCAETRDARSDRTQWRRHGLRDVRPATERCTKSGESAVPS